MSDGVVVELLRSIESLLKSAVRMLQKLTVQRGDSLSYSYPHFAEAVDVSVEKVRQHIERGELVPTYIDSKPVIMREEGLRWLRARPTEKTSA